jgi:hypothetical protein
VIIQKDKKGGDDMYIVKWCDFCGGEHIKKYKTIGRAIKKCFEVHGLYKNGECIKESDGTKIL